MKNLNFSKELVFILVLAIILGASGGAVSGFVVASQQQQKLAQLNKTTEVRVSSESEAMIKAISEVKPAVVSIIATKDLQIVNTLPFNFFFFGQPITGDKQDKQTEPETRRQEVGSGSGFIVTEDGLVITNKHVVRDPEADYSVVLADGKNMRAKVVSLDPANDLAVIQILEGESGETKPSKLPTVRFGSSKELKIGTRVIAIGNALGEFANTVTSGIVSAVSREIEASDGNGRNADLLTNLIQTDAAINGGNSGGPLINLNGEVVGINTATATNANGIGFAIPIDDVKPIFASVQEFGKIVRPQLGARYVLLNQENAKEFGTKTEAGALIIGNDLNGEFAVLPDSSAAEAGLKSGDIITAIDGSKITEQSGPRELIRNKKVGDTIKLTVLRDGKSLTLTAKLKEAK
jgi:serine protease Do